MFDTISGLPVHPLVVHAVVVLGPLVALGLVGYAVMPRWRIGLRWPLLGLAIVSALSAFTAVESGEKLEHRIGDPAYDHAEKGELAAIAIYVLLAAVVLCVFLLSKVGAEKAGILGIIVAVLAAGFLTFAVVNAGHSGAKSAWYDEIKASTPTGGESGDDD